MPKQETDVKSTFEPTSRAVPRLDLRSRRRHPGPPSVNTSPQGHPGPGGPSVAGRLTDVLSGPLGAIAMQHLRVRPRQVRSIESVDRIVSAAAAMAFEHEDLSAISIEKISDGAGVTPQAAYRYFKDADELVRTGLRCVVVREHEHLITFMAGRVLSDPSEMAQAVASLVLDACDRLHRYPAHLRKHILREYRQVGYDASLLIAELISRDVDGADIRHSLDVLKTSVALTATIAVATASSPKGTASLRGSEFEGLLSDLFASLLQSAGSSFDAFREMGPEFVPFWVSETA